MKKIGIFLADGCEEIEALTVVDVCRRAKMEVTTISITKRKRIEGSRGICFEADTLFEEADFDALDGLVLPGGMPGTLHLGEHEGVKGQVLSFFEKGKLVAAICAAPSVLGSLGVLKGKRATCHPGFEEKLLGAEAFTCVPVVRDTNVITSRGMGTALDFALEIVRYFTDEETIFQVRKGLVC